MRLGICVVTFNRLEYTREVLKSLSVLDGDYLVVVDNASSDGTERLATIRNGRNLFPGAATNIGWHQLAKQDVTHLMRLDNDMQLLPGWREEVERCFDLVPNLGMLGIHNRHEDWTGNPPVELDETGTVNVHWDQVGGNCVIPRRFWDEGLRWTCGAWAPGGLDEDSRFAAEIRHCGDLVATVVPTIANNLSFHQYEVYPEYYQRTAKLRGLIPELSV